MKVINVLGHQQKVRTLLCQSGDGDMRRIWRCCANRSTAVAIPLPHELRIPLKCFGSSKFSRVEVSPIAVFASKCRNTAFRRNASAGDDQNATVKHYVEKGAEQSEMSLLRSK